MPARVLYKDRRAPRPTFELCTSKVQPSLRRLPDMANTLEGFAQLEPLWDKAIQSPAEISLEEKHQLMEWPPFAEMQANAHKHLGLSVADLIQKAATAPLSLTYPECRLIRDNFRILRLGDMGNRWIWPLKRPDLETKKTQAQAAILTSKELQALRNIDGVFYEKEKTELDGREAKRQQRRGHVPKEWVQKIIDQGDDKSWGYIFYLHKAMAGWEDFKELFEGVLAVPLFGVKGSEEIQDSKVAEFVEFEMKDGELDYLRQRVIFSFFMAERCRPKNQGFPKSPRERGPQAWNSQERVFLVDRSGSTIIRHLWPTGVSWTHLGN